MNTRIFEQLEPVLHRLRALDRMRWASAGLLATGVAGVVLGALRWIGDLNVPVLGAVAFVASGPAAGLVASLMRPRRWDSAAAAADGHHRLKDRAITAVDFAERGDSTPLHQLQLADAESHLDRIVPRLVVPYRVGAVLPLGVAASVLALLLLGLPRTRAAQAAPAAPLDEVVAAAEEARDIAEELGELAKKEDNKELEKLAREMIQKIEEMKQPGVDVKEALAKLSEMQASISTQQAQYNVGQVDAHMKSLGQSMAATQALEAAGQALEQEKYEKAADALEQADPKFDRKEAKTLKEQLKKAAASMSDSGLGELSETTTTLAESLDDSNSARSAAKKLSNLARAQARRKSINDLLTRQCNSLGECKGNCNKNSFAKLRGKKKSDKPSSNFGMATSGNVDGEKTQLGSARNRDNIQGQQGEGPSETETTHSPEGRQVAARQYRDLYKKYRKLTEAALNSEPIPLGHRQTIRRYFELIRPQNDELEKAEPASPPAGVKSDKG